MSKNHDAAYEVSHTIARINGGILGFILAVICGGILFLMTAWLLITAKEGEHVGGHLQLLGQYFVGYRVSWGGAIIGFFYGTLFGGVVGWSIGWLYNVIAGWRQR